MEQKFLNILVVALLVGIIGVSSVAVIQQMSYQSLDSEYQDLLTDYETLSSEWNQTSDDLNTLQSDFEEMQADYLTLIDDYASLSEIHLIVLSNNTNLQQSLDDLQEQYDQLLEDFSLLNASFVNLEQNYIDLQADYDQLQLDYDELQANYNQLLLDYDDLMVQHQVLQDSYNALVLAYATLELQYNDLVLDYNTLLDNYNTLVDNFLALQNDYNVLEISYNTLTTWIRQMILPSQLSVFAEAARRYYFEDYYVQDKWATGNYSGYWTEFARFCRDVVLHGRTPWISNPFKELSISLADAFIYGSSTQYLHWYANVVMNNRAGAGIPTGIYYVFGSEAGVIDHINQEVYSYLDYEYDDNITEYQQPYEWDYIKFSAETAFRGRGDCEDQAIALATSLETCVYSGGGFETAIAIFHDPAHPVYGEFYHGVTLVHINDTEAFNTAYPLRSLWNLGSVDPYSGYTWVWLDATWDVPLSQEPAWLEAYMLTGMNYNIVSIAICDSNGAVSYVPSEAGLGAYVP